MLPKEKIIAFDLDGTLAVSKSPITLEMANLIKELIKRTTVVVISGGWFPQFESQFLPLFHSDYSLAPHMHNLVLLPTSGSQRYEYQNDSWVMTDKNPFPSDVKERAKKLLQQVISSSEYDIPPNPTGDIVEDRDTQITFTPNGQQAPIEIKRLFDPDQSKRKKIKEFLDPLLPEVSILINGSSSIDILTKGFNKAVGLNRLLDKMGLQKSDMIFIGDAIFPGGNDYSVSEAGIKTIAVKDPSETADIIRTWIV